ncbi:hypothetical protein GGF32_004839 [Allomyces javanicus]|nr:hypothetical protein GGF32_004839 [Allomyces javanicus]
MAAEKLDGAACDLHNATGGMTLKMRDLVGEVKVDMKHAVQVVAGISGDLHAISGGVANELRTASSLISGDLCNMCTTLNYILHNLRVFSSKIEQNLHKLAEITNQFTKSILKSRENAVIPLAPAVSPNKSCDGFVDKLVTIKVGTFQGVRQHRHPLFMHKQSPFKT